MVFNFFDNIVLDFDVNILQRSNLIEVSHSTLYYKVQHRNTLYIYNYIICIDSSTVLLTEIINNLGMYNCFKNEK